MVHMQLYSPNTHMTNSTWFYMWLCLFSLLHANGIRFHWASFTVGVVSISLRKMWYLLELNHHLTVYLDASCSFNFVELTHTKKNEAIRIRNQWTHHQHWLNGFWCDISKRVANMWIERKRASTRKRIERMVWSFIRDLHAYLFICLSISTKSKRQPEMFLYADKIQSLVHSSQKGATHTIYAPPTKGRMIFKIRIRWLCLWLMNRLPRWYVGIWVCGWLRIICGIVNVACICTVDSKPELGKHIADSTQRNENDALWNQRSMPFLCSNLQIIAILMHSLCAIKPFTTQYIQIYT